MNLAWLYRLQIVGADCPRGVRLARRLPTLALSCLTTHYASLWKEPADSNSDRPRRDIHALHQDAWTKIDPCLPAAFFAQLTPHWHSGALLRSDYARHQALVEI